ncbi:hypothetical protein L209DRAFT_504237 [Thermothelomyces heterothallicus CBS 203.75]
MATPYLGRFIRCHSLRSNAVCYDKSDLLGSWQYMPRDTQSRTSFRVNSTVLLHTWQLAHSEGFGDQLMLAYELLRTPNFCDSHPIACFLLVCVCVCVRVWDGTRAATMQAKTVGDEAPPVGQGRSCAGMVERK